MTRALLDTDILSEILRGKNDRAVQAAERYIDTFGHYTFSVLSVAEIIHGVEKIRSTERRANFLKFVEGNEVLILGTEEAVYAGEIIAELELRGLPIGNIDPFIAAIAISHRLPLVTGNTKHFERIVRLGYPFELQNWRV
jgi:tRNA(fMet)-specific endonuclease VapC